MDYKNLKVLLVEDNDVMSAYVVSLLKRLGIQEIHLCKDGREALKDTVGSVPDLILSDIHMAPLDGLEFVQQLRQSASEVKRRIPVIFMSADTHQETVAKVMALESVAYIVKPPRLEVLKAKIELAMKAA